MFSSKYFWDTLLDKKDKIALSDENTKVTYEELVNTSKKIAENVCSRSLVFLVCKNCIECVAGYIGFMQKRAVVVLINGNTEKGLFSKLKETYKPQYIWCPNDFSEEQSEYVFDEYKLINCNQEPVELYEELAVLITTSGSTGSPKFVRQSYKNIQANTQSIVEYLSIKESDKVITTLPMSYTYGLSIIQSHLMAGAEIVLTEKTFFDRGFWNFFKEKEITTFGAVPYTYQMLDKLRFLRMDLPSLKYVTQAGGRLGDELHYKFASELESKGKSLVVMYGATEATARMSYVPVEKTVEKAGSVGVAIPGGRFELRDVDGREITETNVVGELVYYGDNVCLGYAESRADLNLGDEWKGRLETGDMALKDKDGYYFIVGRKKRFLKIYGNRVNLVEMEELLANNGYECACKGEDDKMFIYTTSNDLLGVVNYISEKTGLNRVAFNAIHIDEIPRNSSGKIMYSELN